MARRPRGLSDDEKMLWKKVADNTERLHPPRPVKNSFLTEQLQPAPKVPEVKSPRFQIGEAAKPRPKLHELAPSMVEQMAAQRVAMDKKTFGRMKKGRLAPEARIDLHGMTIAQAHPILTRFIMEAVADGRRLVLVITGKGKHRDDGGPIPVRHGVLRHQVPHWLHMPPLKAHVLQISEAHLKHGGHGAYYVYLRRHR
ncbi:Smr/MutS family protein [Aliiroseovarius sp. KMU-50]|uniref:Smr/MutS family protein n=1 Tax=Aliiroseovarius salicola TaxID=3009082 RepID=A0ABT4VXL5_9RHOB|nr:Smr/MutS family protein [Aliiroseovarius sp. KMU-50]MDA5092996.1 Smr/MutS family protein [Aliiroseovarius sp. KMU-50]